MSLDWYPGQHVVLVRTDFPWKTNPAETYPVKGVVYTVRKAFIDENHDAVGMLLVEIVNPHLRYGGEYGELAFPASHFRPLQKLTPEHFASTDAPVSDLVGEPA